MQRWRLVSKQAPALACIRHQIMLCMPKLPLESKLSKRIRDAQTALKHMMKKPMGHHAFKASTNSAFKKRLNFSYSGNCQDSDNMELKRLDQIPFETVMKLAQKQALKFLEDKGALPSETTSSNVIPVADNSQVMARSSGATNTIVAHHPGSTVPMWRPPHHYSARRLQAWKSITLCSFGWHMHSGARFRMMQSHIMCVVKGRALSLLKMSFAGSTLP